jgi:lipoyl(octanoyl) transferase
LEESIIQTIAYYGIKGSRLQGATGVWLDVDKANVRKICAIGIRASHYITMHGFALNVNTDLNYFHYINPCGFVDKGVTSIERELQRKMDMQEVKHIYKQSFINVFKV